MLKTLPAQYLIIMTTWSKQTSLTRQISLSSLNASSSGRCLLGPVVTSFGVDMILEATRQTLDCIKTNMPDAPYFEKQPALARFAVRTLKNPVFED